MHSIPLILQIAVYILFCSTWIIQFLVMRSFEKKYGVSFQIVATSVLWALSLFLITELLSLFSALSALSIVMSWLLLSIAILIVVWHRRENIRLLEIIDSVRYQLHHNTIIEFVFIIIIMVISLIYLLIALTTVPNVPDSMSYHLARILFWIKHRSVSYFDVIDTRLILMPVLSEYINLHTILLTGDDYFVNLPQVFSALGCIMMVYSILRKLNVERSTSLIVTIIMLGMNIFNAEATTTQVDMVAAFELCILTYFFTVMLKAERNSIYCFILIGITAGLIYITKTNVIISAIVIAATFFIIQLVKLTTLERRTMVSGVVLAISIAILIVAPTWIRNYQYTEDILASNLMGSVAVSTTSPVMLFVNMLKNFFRMTVGRKDGGAFESVVTGTANLLHVDVNAPEITYNANTYQLEYSTYCDSTAAPIFMVPFIIAVVLFFVHVFARLSDDDVYYKHIAWFNGALLLQMIASLMVIRYQPWVTRLLLPSLVVAIIPIGYFFDRTFRLIGSRCDSGKNYYISRKTVSDADSDTVSHFQPIFY